VPDLALVVVILLASAAVASAWLYFRRVEVGRPPLGVLSFGDVVVMVAGIVVLPLLYLALPPVVPALVLSLAITGILVTTLSPILGSRTGIIVAIGLAVADVVVSLWSGGTIVAIAVNDTVLLLAIVGVANLWAQGGMRAGHVAFLGVALAVYDLVATSILTTTGDLFARLSGLPFAPLVAWPTGRGEEWIGVGLGDLLVAAVFPIVFRKAFARSAGFAAGASALTVIAGLLVLVDIKALTGTFPVMVVLGPVIVAEYLWQHRRLGSERTTVAYLTQEPRVRPAVGS
jgi:hypothetical protein